MSADSVLHMLAEITVASSAAILIVGALRKPIRRIAGACVAYWLWFAVPANVLALWFPAPLRTPQAFTHSLASSLAGAVHPALITTSADGGSGAYAATALVTWVSGVFLLAIWLVNRQQAFIRSLGCQAAGADGFLRSDYIAAPMLIGVWRPRVVVPADFEARYPEEDRVLMLAHERAHRERGDTVVNSIATASLCLFWFNPLMYWAVGQFRFDQELACDALVLARSEISKKRYADALLKAQLVSESARWVPVGCHWRSGHPLKERITMLQLASPELSRRLSGIVFNAVLTISSMYAVSVSFAQAPVQPPSLTSRSNNSTESADRKFTIEADNTDTHEVLAMIARKGNHNVLVSDQIHGKITVHLKNVTWQEALNIVAQSEGLVIRESGDITIVGVPH
jgi:bla regulator protein BlaR1